MAFMSPDSLKGSVQHHVTNLFNASPFADGGFLDQLQVDDENDNENDPKNSPDLEVSNTSARTSTKMSSHHDAQHNDKTKKSYPKTSTEPVLHPSLLPLVNPTPAPPTFTECDSDDEILANLKGPPSTEEPLHMASPPPPPALPALMDDVVDVERTTKKATGRYSSSPLSLPSLPSGAAPSEMSAVDTLKSTFFSGLSSLKTAYATASNHASSRLSPLGLVRTGTPAPPPPSIPADVRSAVDIGVDVPDFQAGARARWDRVKYRVQMGAFVGGAFWVWLNSG